MATAEQYAYEAMSQVEDMWHYHPAWFVISLCFLYHSFRWCFSSVSKKRFTKENCTNIMITGGAQGLGKLLAEQFIRRNQVGSVNLIIVDIREDLAPQLLKDAKAISGDIDFKNIRFYKANLGDVETTREVWRRIV